MLISTRWCSERVRFAVGIPGVSFPLSSHTERLLKIVSTTSLFDGRHLGEVVENKPASSLFVSLGKALNGMPPLLCGRQGAQKPRKWQLPSECGRPVRNVAIRFAFSWMENKHEQIQIRMLIQRKNEHTVIFFSIWGLISRRTSTSKFHDKIFHIIMTNYCIVHVYPRFSRKQIVSL